MSVWNTIWGQSQGIQTHVFCDTFASPTIGNHVFYDTSTSPTIGNHVFYDTFASPTIGNHIFYDTFASPGYRNARLSTFFFENCTTLREYSRQPATTAATATP